MNVDDDSDAKAYRHALGESKFATGHTYRNIGRKNALRFNVVNTVKEASSLPASVQRSSFGDANLSLTRHKKSPANRNQHHQDVEYSLNKKQRWLMPDMLHDKANGEYSLAQQKQMLKAEEEEKKKKKKKNGKQTHQQGESTKFAISVYREQNAAARREPCRYFNNNEQAFDKVTRRGVEAQVLKTPTAQSMLRMERRRARERLVDLTKYASERRAFKQGNRDRNTGIKRSNQRFVSELSVQPELTQMDDREAFANLPAVTYSFTMPNRTCAPSKSTNIGNFCAKHFAKDRYRFTEREFRVQNKREDFAFVVGESLFELDEQHEVEQQQHEDDNIDIDWQYDEAFLFDLYEAAYANNTNTNQARSTEKPPIVVIPQRDNRHVVQVDEDDEMFFKYVSKKTTNNDNNDSDDDEMVVVDVDGATAAPLTRATDNADLFATFAFDLVDRHINVEKRLATDVRVRVRTECEPNKLLVNIAATGIYVIFNVANGQIIADSKCQVNVRLGSPASVTQLTEQLRHALTSKQYADIDELIGQIAALLGDQVARQATTQPTETYGVKTAAPLVGQISYSHDKALRDVYEAHLNTLSATMTTTSASEETTNDTCKTPPMFCEICCDELMADEHAAWLRLTRCGHAACLTCWREYITTSVNGLKTTAATNDAERPETRGLITCLYDKCHTPLDLDVVRSLVPLDVCARYVAFYTDMSLLSADGRRRFVYCKSAKCDRIIVASSQSVPVSVCACGYAMCNSCHQAAHFPATCDQTKRYLAYLKVSFTSQLEDQMQSKCFFSIVPGLQDRSYKPFLGIRPPVL